MAQPHTHWFRELTSSLRTADGLPVTVVELVHSPDGSVLSDWARHFRNHYIKDGKLDDFCAPTGLTRSEYLRQFKFPDSSSIGSSTRAADFAEILVADFLEYVLGYLVPRTRYDDKRNRNQSPAGTDIIAFRIHNHEKLSNNDTLLTCEVKAALQTRSKSTLSNAIEDSKKDFMFRRAEALNAMRQRLKDRDEHSVVTIVDRFQNKTDRPYTEMTGAAVVHSNHTWEDQIITGITANEHPNKNLYFLVIRGEKFMDLANALYERACNEA